MEQGNKPVSNFRPVVDYKTGHDGADETGKEPFYKSASFGYFFSMFCGSLIGSLFGTILFKILTQLL